MTVDSEDDKEVDKDGYIKLKGCHLLNFCHDNIHTTTTLRFKNEGLVSRVQRLSVAKNYTYASTSKADYEADGMPEERERMK